MQVTVLNVTTPSTVPPSFTVTAVSNFTEGEAMLTVATNESAWVYYMVLLQSAIAPSAAQVHTLITVASLLGQMGLSRHVSLAVVSLMSMPAATIKSAVEYSIVQSAVKSAAKCTFIELLHCKAHGVLNDGNNRATAVYMPHDKVVVDGLYCIWACSRADLSWTTKFPVRK